MSDNNSVVKGLAITTPLLGRISIGHRAEKNGKLLPVRDDSITITSQVRQGLDWVEHPLQKHFEDQLPTPKGDNAEKKLRSIPVKVMFDRPDLNVRAEYAAFDSSTGRPLCTGDGEKARRFVAAEGKTDEVACPGPQYCDFAKTARCKLHGRLNIAIEGQDDPLAAFIFRTSGYNSVKTLVYRIKRFQELCNGKLAGFPLALKIRAKSTAQSMGRPVYYLDLVLRDGMNIFDAMKECTKYHADMEEAGFNLQAYELGVANGIANGAFEDTDEDGLDIVNEFYVDGGSDEDDDTPLSAPGSLASMGGLSSLSQRLIEPETETVAQSTKTLVEVNVVKNDEFTSSEIDPATLSSPSLPPDIAPLFSDAGSIETTQA